MFSGLDVFNKTSKIHNPKTRNVVPKFIKDLENAHQMFNKLQENRFTVNFEASKGQEQ